MPIDTKIEGDPGAIRSTATWLTSSLAAGVSTYADLIHSARRNAGSDWDGDASEAFQAAMTRLGKRGDDLDAATKSTATKLDAYAGALESAQDHMLSAREIATAGGLTLTRTQILEPGPVPSVPPRPMFGGAATPAQFSTYNSAVSAVATQAAAATAYAAAEVEAADGNKIVTDAFAALQPAKSSTNPVTQWGIYSAGATATFGSEAVNRGVSAMRGQSAFLMKQAAHDLEGLRTSTNAAEALVLDASLSRNLDAAKLALRNTDEAEFGTVGRAFGGKLPVVGLAITAASVGYDIHEGKPASSAIVGGLGGIAGGAVAGVLIASAPVSVPVVLAVGATVALAYGGGVLAEDAWNAWVSDDVRKKIDDGIGAVGEGVASAPGLAWNAIP